MNKHQNESFQHLRSKTQHSKLRVFQRRTPKKLNSAPRTIAKLRSSNRHDIIEQTHKKQAKRTEI